MRTKHKQSGFSIIEVMLAIALGLFLLVSIAKVYLSMKTSYHVQINIARLQENGRLASHILTSNVSMAGYSGCRSFRLSNSIHGFENTEVPNTDIITIKKADTAITHLTRDIDHATDTIYVEDNPATKTKRQLLISDCEELQLFNAENTAKTKIRADRTIQHFYKKLDTEVARVTEITYLIGKTSRKNTQGKPVYALYSITNNGRRQELADGIENMQIKYVIGNNDYSADQVVGWDKVTAVYITLDLNAGDKTKPWKIYIALKERAAQF